MQTFYYTTGSFIRHKDNVVDLTEYRRRLTQAQQRQMPPAEEPPPPSSLEHGQSHPRRSRVRRRRGLFLDACASMGVVVMTLTFTLRILAL